MESNRLLKGHTFQLKETLQICIAEEANLHLIKVKNDAYAPDIDDDDEEAKELYVSDSECKDEQASLGDKEVVAKEALVARSLEYSGNEAYIDTIEGNSDDEFVCVLTWPPVRGGCWATRVSRDSPRAPPTRLLLTKIKDYLKGTHPINRHPPESPVHTACPAVESHIPSVC